MRLWSLHPRHLDAKGLVALWREALLAQKVLAGATRGYRNHPQLQRFRAQQDAQGCIASYLRAVWHEAQRRGYSFDGAKIGPEAQQASIPVTAGQMDYELAHLRIKLAARDPQALQRIALLASIEAHPLFRIVPGSIEPWEVVFLH